MAGSDTAVGSAGPRRFSDVGTPQERLFLGTADHEAAVVERLAGGGLIGFGFANFYALATRPEVDVVRSANLAKGRPPDQVGSVLTTPIRIPDVYDWARLPPELSRNAVLELMDALFVVGPFGFRGPAADTVPDHLTQHVDGVRTTQVIAPGYACPSNAVVGACLRRIGKDVLFVTSANRSHHRSGAAEEPAHYRGEELAAEFAGETPLPILRHPDEQRARDRYPLHAPMSTTILAFHRAARAVRRGRVGVVVDRHGSLAVEDLRRIVEPLGVDLVLGPPARGRLVPRTYPT